MKLKNNLRLFALNGYIKTLSKSKSVTPLRYRGFFVPVFQASQAWIAVINQCLTQNVWVQSVYTRYGWLTLQNKPLCEYARRYLFEPRVKPSTLSNRVAFSQNQKGGINMPNTQNPTQTEDHRFTSELFAYNDELSIDNTVTHHLLTRFEDYAEKQKGLFLKLYSMCNAISLALANNNTELALELTLITETMADKYSSFAENDAKQAQSDRELLANQKEAK